MALEAYHWAISGTPPASLIIPTAFITTPSQVGSPSDYRFQFSVQLTDRNPHVQHRNFSLEGAYAEVIVRYPVNRGLSNPLRFMFSLERTSDPTIFEDSAGPFEVSSQLDLNRPRFIVSSAFILSLIHI